MYSRKIRKSTSGQTLIVALVAFIVILVAILLFFDIQNLIRGKVKGQNAADAAALAGANWQMHSLNLVGELNLAKAATVLLSDASLGILSDAESFTKVAEPEQLDHDTLLAAITRVEEEKTKMKTAIALLTEMQTRISFAGPLIGFGAAQQAAKNNGINARTDVGELFYKYMYMNIIDPNIYGNEKVAPQIINNYAWREPYAEMILNILDVKSEVAYGIAAGTRFNYIGAPSLKSDTNSPMVSFLQSKTFYEAVNGNDWCALIHFLDSSVNFDLSGAWWDTFDCEYADAFLEQSEILPIHIEYFTGATPYDKAINSGAIEKIFKSRNNMTPLDDSFDRADPYSYTADPDTGAITLHTQFDQDGHPVRNAEDTDLKYNILPLVTWAVFDSDWEKYSSETVSAWRRYLVGSFQDGMDYYSGALSYFEIAQPTSTYTGKHNAPGAMKHIGGNRDALGSTMRARSSAAANAGESMKNLSTYISATSSAKPIGKLLLENGTVLSPFEAGGIVFPVFTNAALLPIALEPPKGFGFLDVGWFYYLTEFIPILGNSSSLQEAWNSSAAKYPEHTAYFQPYYEVLKKINNPEWRQSGLAWLETPISFYWDDSGVMHILQKQRDRCNYWGGGSGGGGTRRGPGTLH